MQTREDLLQKLIELIVEKVNTQGPVTAMKIYTEISGEIHQGIHGDYAITANDTLAVTNDAIQHCIDHGKIVELEYLLPQMEYRVKSLYFPAHTVFLRMKTPK